MPCLYRYHIAFNRYGEPECKVTLIERELQLPFHSNEENSGLSLQLNWRIVSELNDNQYSRYDRMPQWLNAAKLKELGFNINNNRSDKGYGLQAGQGFFRAIRHQIFYRSLSSTSYPMS